MRRRECWTRVGSSGILKPILTMVSSGPFISFTVSQSDMNSSQLFLSLVKLHTMSTALGRSMSNATEQRINSGLPGLLRFSTLTHGLSTMAFQCAASELSTNSAQNSRASVMIFSCSGEKAVPLCACCSEVSPALFLSFLATSIMLLKVSKSPKPSRKSMVDAAPSSRFCPLFMYSVSASMKASMSKSAPSFSANCAAMCSSTTETYSSWMGVYSSRFSRSSVNTSQCLCTKSLQVVTKLGWFTTSSMTFSTCGTSTAGAIAVAVLGGSGRKEGIERGGGLSRGRGKADVRVTGGATHGNRWRRLTEEVPR
mmetsp:Transcript_36140/g.64628  ORF Transcript_36140/g.64628 Transcript_36140/m.64628 type:complete len:311 (-) Transcript_36140:14-946(-)